VENFNDKAESEKRETINEEVDSSKSADGYRR
jgi:hypothetical protein